MVVSLSLNSDNFSANLRSINQQLKEAGSKFKLAASGVTGFENTAAGAQAQLANLQQKFQLQQQAVQQYDILGFLDLLTGSSFSQFTLFAMGISPYINASIIIQLLTVAIPAFEKWQKEGPEGRKKLSKITKYTAAGLALFQAIMLYINMNTSGNYFVTDFGSGFFAKAFLFLIIVLSFVAGTSFLTWLGDKFTEVGIGNGISMLIFAGIIARAPV